MIDRNIVSFLSLTTEHKFDCIKESSTKEDEDFWEQFNLPRRHTILSNYTMEEKQKRKRDWVRNHNQKLKIEVFTHYGNGKCACVKCGYSDIRALSIDHVESKRKSHTIEKTGKALWGRLKKTGYPEGFQTLCMNCQFIKRVENNEMSRKY